MLAAYALIWGTFFLVPVLFGMLLWAIRQVRALRSANRELLLANARKDDFFAKMSHELRTPLNAVIGFSDLLLTGAQGNLNSTQQESVRDIHAAGQHLLATINDILDIAKARAGAMVFEKEALELEIPARQAEEMTRPLAQKKGVHVEVRMEPGLLCEADLRRVRQVALNLLSNAIKFTPRGGQVTLLTRCGGDFAELVVQDTGIGVNPKDQPFLFDEFYLVDHPKSGSFEGTGLGLALVKRFVQCMGGTVCLESRPGQGSTFTVRLPSAAAPGPTFMPARVPRVA